MKNIKKLLVLFLVIAMSCSIILTSCGKKDEDNDDENTNTSTDTNNNANKENTNNTNNENQNSDENKDNNSNSENRVLLISEKPIFADLEGSPMLIYPEYDANGNLVRDTMISVDEEAYLVYEYAYDSANKMTGVSVYTDGFMFAKELDYTAKLTLNSDGQSVSSNKSILVEYYENGVVKKFLDNAYMGVGFDFDEKGRRTKTIIENEETSVWSYNENNTAPKTMIVTDGDESYEYVFTYNDDGYLTKASIPADSGFYSSEYTYTSDGQIKSVFLMSEYEEDFELTEFEYDANGNVVKITTKNADTYEEVALDDIYGIFTREYDSSNRVIKTTEIQFYLEENRSKLRYSREYEYDDNNNIKKETLLEYDSVNGIDALTYIDEYEYDSNGRKIKITSTNYETDGSFGGKCIEEIEYDTNGNEIKSIETSYNEDGTVKNKRVYESEYDENGREIKYSRTYYISDGTINDKYVYEYEYTENGKISKETETSYGLGGNIIRKDIYEYEYAANGNIIKEIETCHYYTTDTTSKTVTEYEYNENGTQETKEISTYYDSDGNVTGKNIVEYVYDENGRITKKIVTEYDADGNVTNTYTYTYGDKD